MQGLENGASLSVSVLILAVASWQAFNTPPTNRSGTTFFLFCLGFAFYLVLMVVLWLIEYAVLSTVGLAEIGLPVNGAAAAALVPVVAALALLLGIRCIPRVPDWDARARDVCIRLAQIPRERDRLTRELTEYTPFAVTQPALDQIVAPDLEQYGVPAEALRVGAGAGRVAPALLAFQRAALLRLRLGAAARARLSPAAERDPLTPAYRACLAELSCERDQAREQYEALLAYAGRYFASPGFQAEKADEFRAMSDAVFARYARLLAMSVLTCERTESGRNRKLSEFGFEKQAGKPALTRDQLVSVTLLVIVVLGGFEIVAAPPHPGHPVEASSLLLMVGLELTLAVLLGTAVGYRAPARAVEDAAEHQGQPVTWPPLAEALFAAVLAAAGSFALRVVFRLAALAFAAQSWAVPLQQLEAAVAGVLLHGWVWLLFPFATTVALAISCAIVAGRDVSPRALVLPGGLLLAVTFAGLALVVAAIQPAVARNFLLPCATALGFCLGALILPVFRLTLIAAAAAQDGAAFGLPPVAWQGRPCALLAWRIGRGRGAATAAEPEPHYTSR